MVAAADLGASSGRVMLARVGAGRLSLDEVHRFPNVPVRVGGTLHWDILALYREVLDGVRAAGRTAAQAGDGALASVGIDSWGVDYGLLDESGSLLGNPVHYRDGRTDGVPEQVWARVPAADLYAVTGIQQLPFNTIYQLAAAAGTPQLAAARTLLLIPDLLAYWLTGQAGAERTNASTTQLYDARRGEWAQDLIERAGIPGSLFPPLRSPGDVIGPVQPGVSESAGLPVIAVGSHDTASAVAAVPARGRDFAYISSGTWSLVGMELDAPVLTEASRRAGFTNEAGLDGRTRYLHNVTGLWLLQESMRGWAADGREVDLDGLLAEAAARPPLVSLVDPDDPEFLPPGDMAAAGRNLPPGRRPGPADPGRGDPLHPGQPGPGLPAHDPGRPGAVRAAGQRHPHGGRRDPEPPAVPAHRGRLRAAGHRRAGGGGRPGQRAGPGRGAGGGARRPGRHQGPAARDPGAAPVRAQRRSAALGRRGPPATVTRASWPGG